MSDELRRNPDTGDVERKVVSYEKIEQAQLQAEVDSHAATVEQKTQREQELTTELETVRADKSAAETALADAKSNLEAYEQVAVVESGDADGGSEATDTAEVAEGEAEVDEPAVEGADVPQF